MDEDHYSNVGLQDLTPMPVVAAQKSKLKLLIESGTDGRLLIVDKTKDHRHFYHVSRNTLRCSKNLPSS